MLDTRFPVKIVRDLTSIKAAKPVVLSIGNFDGMHLGHKAVLEAAKKVAEEKNEKLAVITFSNHPSEVLRPHDKTALICTPEQRIRLLEQSGVDFLLLLQFTKEFSEQSPEAFLNKIYATIPFSDLVLGHDATLGKNREGDKDRVITHMKQHGVNVHYVEPLQIEGVVVSSSKIRKLIQSGELTAAEKLLGRKYSIYASVVKGKGVGSPLGYPTANIAVEGLCLPPLGVYAVKLFYEGKSFQGVANLGVAPTVRKDSTPILEVHLYDDQLDLYGKMIEVQFYSFLRAEQRFPNLDALKQQISRDVEQAKQVF